MELTYEVRGTITDESGVPVPSARITFYESWVNANVTDNKGGFEERVRVLGEVISDEYGVFELIFSTQPGLKQISIKRDGFLEKNTTFLLNSEDTTPITGPYALKYAGETSSRQDEEEMLIKHE